MRHPVVFFSLLFVLMIVLGLSFSTGPLFYMAALASGVVWQARAATVVPGVEAGRARARIAESRRHASVRALPPLRLPSVAHVLLPRGQKIQVTKEDQHAPQMGALLAEDSERHLAATLHRMPPSTTRSSKERVQVRIDDAPVGELTPYMSEHFLPLIRVCDERGITVACAALVKGNMLKADVVLDAARAIDLDDGWIEEHVLGAGESAG
ncbi:MAG: hypothetical protein ABIS84_13860 [Arachnia sp.]